MQRSRQSEQAILANLGWVWGGLPNDGWFNYANLSERFYSPGLNIDFYDVGLLILGTSTIMGALNLFVTIVNLRAPCMTLFRMPMFAWAILITTVLILLAFPPLTVALIFLFTDRYFDTHFYRTIAGGTPILWEHLFWIFGHPEVYIMALPAFGMISEIIPVFSRKPLFGYPMMVYSLVLVGFLSYGVWGHHMFLTGMGPIADSTFSVTSMLIAIPTKEFQLDRDRMGWRATVHYRHAVCPGVPGPVHNRRAQWNHACGPAD
jgi:cytochrome c oxidase subunit I